MSSENGSRDEDELRRQERLIGAYTTVAGQYGAANTFLGNEGLAGEIRTEFGNVDKREAQVQLTLGKRNPIDPAPQMLLFYGLLALVGTLSVVVLPSVWGIAFFVTALLSILAYGIGRFVKERNIAYTVLGVALLNAAVACAFIVQTLVVGINLYLDSLALIAFLAFGVTPAFLAAKSLKSAHVGSGTTAKATARV